MKATLVRGLLIAIFLLLSASSAAAVECCCNLSGSCSGQICRICDGCTGCSISCNGCDSTSSCGQCEINGISGQFENVALSDALAHVVAGTSFQVTILGNPDVRVSVEFKNEPIRHVLARIESLAGVQLEVSRNAAIEGTALPGQCGSTALSTRGWQIAARPARRGENPQLAESGAS